MAPAVAERQQACAGPTLIECRTYRLSGHSRGDRREYRQAHEEHEAWQREPILRFAAQLRDQQVADEDALRACQEAVRQQVEAAIRCAEESPLPEIADVAEGVYA